MSLYDDNFELEHYFENQIKNSTGKSKKDIINFQKKYRRIWNRLCELSNEYNETTDVQSAISAILNHIINEKGPIPLMIDTKLPYVFDLYWDAKTFGDLIRCGVLLRPDCLRLLAENGFDVRPYHTSN